MRPIFPPTYHLFELFNPIAHKWEKLDNHSSDILS